MWVQWVIVTNSPLCTRYCASGPVFTVCACGPEPEGQKGERSDSNCVRGPFLNLLLSQDQKSDLLSLGHHSFHSPFFKHFVIGHSLLLLPSQL